MSTADRESHSAATAAPESLDGDEEATTGDDAAAGSGPDDVFDVLSNRRRRYALHYLGGRADEEVEIREVAEQVAAWENGKPVERVERAERKRVHTALHQFHFPKLAACGFVDYDSRRGRVSLGETTAKLDVYVDVVSEDDIAWGPYYVGLTGLGMATLLAAWADVVPFAFLPDAAWGALVLVAFLVSALVHCWRSFRMRLGTGEKPPELRA